MLNQLFYLTFYHFSSTPFISKGKMANILPMEINVPIAVNKKQIDNPKGINAIITALKLLPFSS